ncbi:MAG TPA: hypothetical protein VMW66_03800 [Elusimicrobiales bacterium]|nr:hypothetical protein [Elusimicrobiales bacterium]
MNYFRKIIAITFSFILCANNLFAAQQDEEFYLIEKSDFPSIFEEYDAERYALPESIIEPELNLYDTKQDWNATREAIETNTLYQEVIEQQQPQTILKPKSKELAPSVKLPAYGTSLSITGRKIIGFDYASKRYLFDQTSKARAEKISSFNLTQQMQLKMKGKIGPKISIDIDYDDTQEDKKDISITYTGEKDEVVQSAAFGDIDLSLPATEFVSYNKQLFGMKMDLKFDNARAILIGSRTKGEGKTKEFTGNSAFQSKDILDIEYIRRQYYDLTFGNPARIPAQSSEIVYIKDRSGKAPNGLDIKTIAFDDIESAVSAASANFKYLQRGLDYAIDYNRGTITFNRQLNSEDVVIIDFVIQGTSGVKLSQNPSAASIGVGGTGKFKLIKTENDLPIVEALQNVELGYRREIKTYYSIGQTQIIRDDGKGNFNLRVQDENRIDIDPALVSTYPEKISVDFERGVFALQTPFSESEIYDSSPSSKYRFRVEYNSRIRTFFLEPSIVLESDVVTIDGKKLIRNTDYFIDYDSGFITFYNESIINPYSKIVVNYDVSPFGGIGTSALLGGRFSYDLGEHITFGSTVLYESGTESKTAPTVNSLAASTLVYEADLKIKDFNILPGIKSNFEVEVAQSKTNPNVNGFAVIESMESVKQEDFTSTEAIDWRIASNPTLANAHPYAVNWTTEEVQSDLIYPGANDKDKERVITIEYDFTNSDEISIVYPYKLSGIDFTRKNTVEMILYPDGTSPADTNTVGPEINLTFGKIDEDSDDAGEVVSLQCKTGTNVPKTEDINCDGILTGSEDVGWQYKVGADTRLFGAGNGIIDSQDLNSNKVLDPADYTGGDFGYANATNFIDLTDGGTPKNQIDFLRQWHTFYAQVNIPVADKIKWSAIRQVRISLKKSSLLGARTKGFIKIAKLAVVGNSWEIEDVPVGSTLNLSGINNEDDPAYQPIFSAGGEVQQVFEDLYGSLEDQKEASGSDTVVEQSLEMIYSTTGSSEVTAKRIFSSSMDISNHKELRFLINNPALKTDTSFFLRIGTGTDYQQVEINLDNFTGWRLYRLRQVDADGDDVADYWENASVYPATVTSAGQANLQGVSLITAGIKTSSAQSGTVWLNEIHLSGPLELTGTAYKAQADFEIKGLADFGGKYKYMDRNFQTPIAVATKQDKAEQSAYFNLKKYDWMPVTATYERQITTTPNPLDSQNNNLVNLIEKGTVDRRSGGVKADIITKNLPKISLEYLAEKANYELLERNDDIMTYRARVEHILAKKNPFLPTKFSAGYGETTSKINYGENSDALTEGYYNSKENVRNIDFSLEFNPIKDSAFIPTYSLMETKEDRGDTAQTISYDKSMHQNAGFKGNLKVIKWLKPSFDYNISTIENNNLTGTTVTHGIQSQTFDVGEIKTVNRTATGNVSFSINAAEIMPKSKLLKSLTIYSGYQLQDGDVWNNVESALDSKSSLWIRNSLKPSSSFAERINLTLRDTVNSSQRWQPFSAYEFNGGLSALKKLSISNNVIKSVQQNDVTGTQTKTVSTTLPDTIVTMHDIEKLAGLGRWVSDSILNFKFTRRTTENVDLDETKSLEYGLDLRFKLLNKLDTALKYNIRKSDTFDFLVDTQTISALHKDMGAQGSFTFKKLTLTPKIDYTLDKKTESAGVVTEDTTVMVPAVILRIDTNLPKGFTIPIINKTLKFTNRIVWTTSLSYAIKTSPVNVINNSNIFNITTDAEYEVSKNLLLTFSGQIERLWHKYLQEEDYVSVGFGTTLTLQF